VRLAYLGTSEFAAGVLRRLADAGAAPELVVTRPDRPKGRGRRVASPPVADAARELGLEVHQPERVSDDERLLGGGFDQMVVCAYGALIREPLLSAATILNVHPSLLPRWRGAAPVERAIMAGDAETGVAIMQLVAGLDEGPVALMERTPIAADDDYGTLSGRLEEIGARLLLEALRTPQKFRPQGEEGVTYAEKITAEDRLLDAARPIAELERRVRALHPHIGARAEVDGQTLGVLRARVANDGDGLLLPAADGALELLEVQPPGGRPMDAAAYLRGRRRP